MLRKYFLINLLVSNALAQSVPLAAPCRTGMSHPHGKPAQFCKLGCTHRNEAHGSILPICLVRGISYSETLSPKISESPESIWDVLGVDPFASFTEA